MDGASLWVAVVDDHQVRLMRARFVAGRGPQQRGRKVLRLDDVATLTNGWLELDGDLASGATRHHVGDRRSELLARYVLDLAGWLAAAIRGHHIEDLHVFAPTRLESLLRSMHAPTLGPRVELHRADLAGLERDELEREPALLELTGRGDSRQAS